MIKNSIAVLTLLLLSAVVSANIPMLKNDPNRPVGKISRDLGIMAAQFIACFNNVKPVAKGNKPTKQRERMNKAVLLPCLQKANRNITNDKLDKVMGRYRPKPG